MGSAPADAARHLARAILAEGRFHQPSVPRPLHGVLHALGEGVRVPVHALGDAVDAIGSVFPGGVVVVWIILALAAVTAAGLLAGRRTRRTLTSDDLERGAGAGPRAERASELLRSAEAAERQGRLADAVRLRFRAGLLRLAERGTIETARSTPTIDVSRTLRSPEFDALARRFDEITYGGSPPVAADVEAARREWPVVLEGSERR
ncbi:MAG TPA: hypothetical protein VG295_00550 [Solirubrobacteraceae bacterium]|nr:hypothetical protein [Solirubrobacteraceae bacterium]